MQLLVIDAAVGLDLNTLKVCMSRISIGMDGYLTIAACIEHAGAMHCKCEILFSGCTLSLGLILCCDTMCRLVV